MSEYAVKLRWDDDAAVWVAMCDEIPLAMDAAILLMPMVRRIKIPI
jgi:hypothetical protein